MQRGRSIVDKTGKRYGHLTVLALSDMRASSNRGTLWLCRCDCGRELLVLSSNLHSSGSQSCGCQRDLATRARFDMMRQLAAVNDN